MARRVSRPELVVRRFAQLEDVTIPSADFCVLVGPQATGKSLALQLLKLAIDGPCVAGALAEYGFEWGKDRARFAERYFGAGMGSAWSDKTTVALRGTSLSLAGVASGKRTTRDGHVFYIPAHRSLTMPEGWPLPFLSFGPASPFVVREFSEHLRKLLENGFGQEQRLFPAAKRFTEPVRAQLDEAIFHGAELSESAAYGRKQLTLDPKTTTSQPLGYMSWTAGQREFVPLMLGAYWLAPGAAASKRKGVQTIVIEEPEMGLHPKGILATMLLVLELVSRGYRVFLSTHSPLVLDVMWAMRIVEKHPTGADALARAFGLMRTPKQLEVFRTCLGKRRAVVSLEYDRDVVRSRDISELDPTKDDPRERGWGGLTSFSTDIGDAVAWSVNEASR